MAKYPVINNNWKTILSKMCKLTLFVITLAFFSTTHAISDEVPSMCETDPMYYDKPLLTGFNPKEIWVCLGEYDTHYGYSFYDRGDVKGIDMYLGMRVELSVSQMTLAKTHHSWCISDDHLALYFFSETRNLLDTWTDVIFTADGMIQAISGYAGALSCKKITG